MKSNKILPINCIICNKEIHPLFLSGSEKKLLKNNPEKLNWEGGAVVRIYFGYGSILDEDVYLIAICDNCVIQKYNEGAIKKCKK